MSAQFLICKFAVFSCFHFIFISGLCDLHGSLARGLSRPVILIVVTAWQSFQTDIYMYRSYFELCILKKNVIRHRLSLDVFWKWINMQLDSGMHRIV